MSISRTRVHALALAAALVPALAVHLAAQTKLDRTIEPPPTAPKSLHVPTWTDTKLANGAELIVTPKRDLPLVSFTITFVGGANQFEPAGH